MARYRVEGLHQTKGERIAVLIDADSPAEAEQQVSRRGVVVDPSATRREPGDVEKSSADLPVAVVHQSSMRFRPSSAVVRVVAVVCIAVVGVMGWTGYTLWRRARIAVAAPTSAITQSAPLKVNGLVIPLGFEPPPGKPALNNSMVADGVQILYQSVTPTVTTSDGQAWSWTIVIEHWGKPRTSVIVTAVWYDRNNNAITWSDSYRTTTGEGRQEIDGRWWLPTRHQSRVASAVLWFEPDNQ